MSSEQLLASIAVPAGLGADGVLIWGASSDARVEGYSQTITSALQSTVGPLIKRCQAGALQCAAAVCSAHGRCSRYDAAAPEKGCAGPSPGDAVACNCDKGWSGATCSTQQAKDSTEVHG